MAADSTASAAAVPRTIALNEALSLSKREPLDTFDAYPIDVIRESCLKHAPTGWSQKQQQEACDWAELHFRKLDAANDPFAEKVLTWYLETF